VSNRLIVIAPEPKDFHVTLEQFRVAITHWQPHARLVDAADGEDLVDANIQVERPDQYFFQIFHFRDGDMVSTDGTREQAAEVAVWAANSFPKTGDGELWLTDEAYTGHAVLHPGMSATDIWESWQDHS
jgi:hypothetical protein